jgi:hypothetical protein
LITTNIPNSVFVFPFCHKPPMINFDIKEEGQKRNLYSLEIRIGLEGGPLPKGVGSGYPLICTT